MTVMVDDRPLDPHQGVPVGLSDTPAGASVDGLDNTPAGVPRDRSTFGSTGPGDDRRSCRSGEPERPAESASTAEAAPESLGDLGDLELVALERLEHGLTTLAAHLAAGEARWLKWLEAYDRRAGWQAWGCRSAAEWLNNKCGMSLTAGRERVRVARTLQHLPLIQAAFANGELSYSKARAITRAATPDSESDLLDIARSATASQLDKICSGVANARPPSNQDNIPPNSDANPSDDALPDDALPDDALPDDALPDDALLLAKQFAASRSNDDGTSTLRVCLADDTMAMVIAAIDTKVDELITDMTQGKELTRRQAIDHHGGHSALRARAFATIITDSGAETTVMLTIPIDTIDAEGPIPSDTAGPPMPGAGAQQSRRRPNDDSSSAQRPEPQQRSDLNKQQSPSPERPNPDNNRAGSRRDDLRSTVARLLCDCRINMTVVDENGGPLSIGRRSRVIPTKIRTALEIRDHGICRFPGCGSTRNLQTHHVVHWQHGGPTELSNLVLLCWFHHDLLHGQAANDATSVADHQGCWTVEPVPTNESKAGGWFRFRTPNGDLATVEHSRGSVNALYWHTREHLDAGSGESAPGRTRLEPINGGRLQDLSWITASVIHNETIQRHHDRDHDHDHRDSENEEPAATVEEPAGPTETS